MNKLFVTGRLTADPILREATLSNGTVAKVANFNIAVNTKNHAGVESTQYFKVTAWRGLGESCAQYLTKGRRVTVVGRVGLDTYTKNGNTYNTLAVSADEVEFLDAPQTAGAAVTDAELPSEEDEDVMGL